MDYYQLLVIIAFFSGIIVAELSRNNSDASHPNKTEELLRCDCKNCKYTGVIDTKEERGKLVPYVSCIKFPTWHDAPIACRFFEKRQDQ